MKNIEKPIRSNVKHFLSFLIINVLITHSLSTYTRNKSTFRNKSQLSSRISFRPSLMALNKKNPNKFSSGDPILEVEKPVLQNSEPQNKPEIMKMFNEELASQQDQLKPPINQPSDTEMKQNSPEDVGTIPPFKEHLSGSNEIQLPYSNLKGTQNNKEEKIEGYLSQYRQDDINLDGSSINTPEQEVIEKRKKELSIKSARMEKVNIEQQWMEAKKKAKLLNTNGEKILKSGWLKISSVKFLNPKFFPKMSQGCGKYVKLLLDKDYFLMNPDNDDMELNQLRKEDTNYYFYFRLTKYNLYFTISTTERHVLGTLLVMSIISIDPVLKYSDEELCFKIIDIDQKYWVLCALDLKEKMEWFCKLYEELGKFSTLCIKKEKIENIVETTIEKSTIIVPYPSRFCNDNWNYYKHGDDWECECSEGREQSPIDLPHYTLATPTMIRPVFSYSKVNPTADETIEEFHMVDKENIKTIFQENMIRIYHKEFGRVVTNDEIIYIAQEIQFHTPAEHTIKGKRYDMEMQIIHNGIENGIGKQLILSFLFIAEPGIKNLFIEDINYLNLPNQFVKERELKNEIYIPKIFYKEDNNKNSFVFKYFSFYTYEGSLTNPPCAESTVLYVCADPIPVSILTINLFKEVLNPNLLEAGYHADFLIGGQNLITSYRNVQNVNGREVFYYDCSDYCIKEKEQEKRIEGHFEKIDVKAYQYFYLDSKTPSGIPDSYVVSPEEALNLNVEITKSIED